MTDSPSAGTQMAIFSNYGTVPEWSPYRGRVVQKAITFNQQNVWHDNTYHGPWTFVGYETGPGFNPAERQAELYQQDVVSTFSDNSSGPSC